MKASIPGGPHTLGPEALDTKLRELGVCVCVYVCVCTHVCVHPPSLQSKKGANKSQAGREGSLLTHSESEAERCSSLG